jgi:hypothetical protein
MKNEFKLANVNIEPLVISFYTVNTPYEQEALNLKASCEEWGLKYCIEGMPSRGTWEKNCGIKPHFILEKMEQLQQPVLWVDADAVFLKKPSFDLFQGYDFSVRIMEFIPWRNPSKVMSGTIYVDYTPPGLDLLRRWAKNCDRRLKKDGRIWDQYVLRELILREKKAKILPLPVAYCKIYDLDILFIQQEHVVIEHYQASRRVKI